LDQKEQPKNE
jgi:hypothetical protein